MLLVEFSNAQAYQFGDVDGISARSTAYFGCRASVDAVREFLKLGADGVAGGDDDRSGSNSIGDEGLL